MPRKPHAARRAGLYARVSTDDRGQDPETQLRQLREYAARRGFTLTAEFVDHASGTRDDRPSYKRLLVVHPASSVRISWAVDG